jgi:phenylacetic acid degradation protein paaN
VKGQSVRHTHPVSWSYTTRAQATSDGVGPHFDPDLVQLAAEDPFGDLASRLATRPEVRIIDFTGSTRYGNWLEDNARQARVYTEKSGVNAIVIDSVDDFVGMCRHLAFSLSLYSGQMCTTPQNVLIPRTGIETSEGHKSFDEVVHGIADAIDKLLADPARAVELTGAIVNDDVLRRVEQATQLGEVVLKSRTLQHPAYSDAVVRTPTIVKLASADEASYPSEVFGPVSFAIATADTDESIDIFRRTVGAHGAITAGVYSTDESVLDRVHDAACEVGVAVSFNLTGPVYVNQTVAFSDFHATGANPAATACYADAAFVAERFRFIEARREIRT